MSKIRVYELARELKVESKALVPKIKDMGIDVSSHQSTLSADQVVRIKRLIQGAASNESVKSPTVIRRRRQSKPSSQEAAGASQEEGNDDIVATATEASATVAQQESPTKESKEEVVETSASEKADQSSLSKETHREEGPEVAEKVEEPVAVSGVASSLEQRSLNQRSQADESSAVKYNESENLKDTDKDPKVIKPSEKKLETPSSNQSKLETPTSEKLKKPEVEPREQKKVAKTEGQTPMTASAGSATIVRRATKDEVAKVQREREERADRRYGRSDRGRGGPRSESSRSGQRPFRGDRSSNSEHENSRQQEPRGNRPQPPNNAGSPSQVSVPSGDFEPAPVREKWGEVRRDKKRAGTAVPGVKAVESTEASAAARKALKQKRDHISTRALLSQFSGSNEETEEPQVAPSNKKRTVYTPQSAGKKRDLKRRKDLKKTQITTPKASLRVVKMGNDITVGDLARQLSVKSGELIKKLMSSGIMATINQNVDFDTASLMANEYGYEVKSTVVSLDDILAAKKETYASAEQEERSPIVTIMGHVDHGKTSILDAIRKAKVAAGEAGGITQHIGAYTVEKDGRSVAFLDTPGHEAFSAMRSRGAQVTDIVILVVAADDGVMPQTIEAISHAKDAGVPIIVAVNKIDKPNINLDRVYTELTEHGIQSEEWGGDTQFVKVSALKGTGLDDLLEAVLLQAEMLELKAVHDAPASGVVVEAHLDRGRGPVATMIVREGTLKVGDHVVAGAKVGRVRAMTNHLGRRLKVAGPSTPVEIVGLSEVPMAGDSVDVVEGEKQAREVATWRVEQALAKASAKSSAASLEELLSRVKDADTPEVPVIVKADTQGSVEAVTEAVMKLNSEKVRNRVVHKAVGGINESDLSLAETSGAVLLAFNVRAARGLEEEAEKRGVLVKYFSVIYEIVDALKAVMAGKLPPIQREVVIGHAEVRQTIKVPKVGLVAGTAITDGKVVRNSNVRLIREDVVVYSGKLGSLKRFKDDVKEVAQGYECGIGIDGYNDIRIGDIIEAFVIEEEAATL